MEKNSGASSLKERRQLPKSSLKRLGGAPSLRSYPCSRVYREASDTNRRKKVKFADSASAHGKGDSSLATESTLAPSTGVPKTSEYRSYKKLREETAHIHHPYQLHKQDSNLKILEASENMEEWNKTTTCRNPVNRCLLPIQKITPVDKKFSHSLPEALGNFEQNKTTTCKYPVSGCLSPIQKITPIDKKISHSPPKALGNFEPDYKHGGVFTKKRHNLLQLAANALSLDVDEFVLKRSDLIPEFLQRLGVRRKYSNHDELSSSGQKKLNCRTQLVASSKSDGELEKFHETVATDPVAAISRKSLRNDLLVHWCKEADELILPSRDYVGAHSDYAEAHSFPTWRTHGSGPKKEADEFILPSRDYVGAHSDYVEACSFPTWRAHESGPKYKRRQSPWADGRASDMHAKRKSAPAIVSSAEFAFNRYGQLTMDQMLSKFDYLIPENFPPYCHFMEKSLVPYSKSSSLQLYDLYNPNVPSRSTREQCGFPLLGWEEKSTEDEPELSIASGLVVPEELDHLPLTLYNAPNVLGQTKAFRFSDAHEATNFNSPSSSTCEMKFQDISHRSLDGLLLTPPPDFELKWKRLQKTDSDWEHCSSIYPNLSLDEEVINSMLNFTSASNRFDGSIDEPKLMKIQSQHARDIFSLADFSSLGLNISVDTENRIFALLPDRLNWY